MRLTLGELASALDIARPWDSRLASEGGFVAQLNSLLDGHVDVDFRYELRILRE